MEFLIILLFIPAIPEHARYISTGYISIEYFVINTSFPQSEAAISVSIVKNTVSNKHVFNLFLITDLKIPVNAIIAGTIINNTSLGA